MQLAKVVIVAAGLGLVSGPAWACEIDPFLFQLPGETETDAHERSDKTIADHETVRHYNRQRSNFENAATIYLARVTARTRGNYVPGSVTFPSAQVQPLIPLKGPLPSHARTLTGEPAGGMCTDIGDGFGAFSNVGTLVVVFEGVRKTEERPRGIDSFQAKAIRIIPRVDELRKHGKDLEE